MSGVELGALLADASQAAAYFIDLRDRAAVVEAATALDFRVATANLVTVDDRAALFAELARALQFSPGVEGDWDALADALGDLAWLPAPGYLLLLDHCADARRRARRLRTMSDPRRCRGAMPRRACRSGRCCGASTTD